MMNTVSCLSKALVALLALSPAASHPSGVLLQAFDWASLSNRNSQFSTIASQASSLKQAGFDGLWFPPPTDSVDSQGYLPQQWYVLEGETNQRNAVRAVKNQGMLAIADIIVNHRTAPRIGNCTGEYTEFENPDWGEWAVVQNDFQGGSNRPFCPSNCNCGNADTGERITYGPDIDHRNNQIRSDIKDYMNFLKNNVGYNGWRYDLVKGFSPEYIREYNQATSPQFSVGEFYDGNADLVQNWVRNSGSDAFDFPLRFTLKDAVRDNRYSSLTFGGFIGRDASKSITFTDNHDTSRAEYGGAFGNRDQIIMGYAFILTHPGTPMVFWSDYQNSSIRNAVQTLMNIRASVGITSTSSRFVDRAENGLYAAYVGNNLAMKIGTNDWSPSDPAFRLQTSGNNYAVWTK